MENSRKTDFDAKFDDEMELLQQDSVLWQQTIIIQKHPYRDSEESWMQKTSSTLNTTVLLILVRLQYDIGLWLIQVRLYTKDGQKSKPKETERRRRIIEEITDESLAKAKGSSTTWTILLLGARWLQLSINSFPLLMQFTTYVVDLTSCVVVPHTKDFKIHTLLTLLYIKAVYVPLPVVQWLLDKIEHKKRIVS